RPLEDLAAVLGANRPRCKGWYSATALPPVKYMRRFAREHRITLDWIYEGDGSALSYPLYIRLVAAMEADAPPPDVAPEPEPSPDSAGPAYPLRRAGAVGPQREKRRRANA